MLLQIRTNIKLVLTVPGNTPDCTLNITQFEAHAKTLKVPLSVCLSLSLNFFILDTPP